MKKKYGRKSVKGVNMKDVNLFPNGKRSKYKTVENLATIGIQLRGNQITDFATSIMDMHKAGYTEVNITGWLKRGEVTFTSESVEKIAISNIL